MSAAPQRVVIIGAGQAGGQTAYSLRQAGFAGSITLVGDEPAPPYQRPPLSKAYFKGEMEAERLFLKPLEYYAEHQVDLVTGKAATAIDLAERKVTLDDGTALAWDKLVIEPAPARASWRLKGRSFATSRSCGRWPTSIA